MRTNLQNPEAPAQATILTDASGSILAMNEAAEQLTLFREEELVGQHSLLVLHDAVELSTGAMQQARSKGAPVSAGFGSMVATALDSPGAPTEWTIIRKDRSRVWTRLTVTRETCDAGTGGYRFVLEAIPSSGAEGDAALRLLQHDPLTGLPNRTLLLERLAQGMEQSERFQRHLAIFTVDLDRFGRLVHSLGALAEETLLIAVARRLHGSVRSTDTVARLGGDQFAVVMPSLREPGDAERCGELMLQTVSVPVVVSGREVRVTASIGFCLFPDAATTAEDLLKDAETAMAAAKAEGRGRCKAYSADLQQQTDDRMDLEEDLRRAPERNEFRLEYQPQVDCREGRVIGMEALLRWTNPRRGAVASNLFIPLAEATGLMVRIGEWGLKQACMDCAQAQRTLGRRLMVAVNLSPQQFKQRGLVAMVDAALRASGLPPEDLEIEITERMLLEPTPSVLNTLAQIRQRGVRIALDDFGTGFSSFSYLLQFGVDHLKIDRSFIAATTEDPSAATIVRTMLSMAHNLSIGVIAEGVETEEQHQFLLERECDSIQGYLFSPAVPIHKLAATVLEIERKYARVELTTADEELDLPVSSLPLSSLIASGSTEAREDLLFS